MTLRQQIQAIFKLYGLRNAMYMRGDQRLLFLLNALRALGKHIRKDVKDKEVLAGAIASVFSRTCSYADSFVDLDIVSAMAAKYPQEYCAYCKRMPCNCAANRQTVIECAPVTGIQDDWSVGDWCTHLDKVYGRANRERGIQFAMARLHEEICEAVDTQFLDTHDPGLDLKEVRQRMSHEFADIFAWIFTISNLLGVDVNTFLESRYSRACHRCSESPCNCGHFSINYLSGSSKMRADSIIAH